MISRPEAFELLESNDLIGIGMQADAIRQKLHPDRIVTYFLPNPGEPAPAIIARLSFSPGESAHNRLDRLDELRAAQEKTKSYIAVAPLFDGAAAEFLKLISISRLYLENIPHVQVSCSPGLKICQIALRFGADDISGADLTQPRPLELPTDQEIRALIRDAGFIPKQRDALFQSYALA